MLVALEDAENLCALAMEFGGFKTFLSEGDADVVRPSDEVARLPSSDGPGRLASGAGRRASCAPAGKAEGGDKGEEAMEDKGEEEREDKGAASPHVKWGNVDRVVRAVGVDVVSVEGGGTPRGDDDDQEVRPETPKEDPPSQEEGDDGGVTGANGKEDGTIGGKDEEGLVGNLPTHVMRDIEWVVDNITTCTEMAETLSDASLLWQSALRLCASPR